MTLDLIYAPFAGALIGFIVGLTGVGGGALMAPILLLGFGLDLQTVVATDLLFATLTKLAAGGMHIRNQLVDWQIVRRLWTGSILATVTVVVLVQFGFIFHNPAWVVSLLGSLIILSAITLIFEKRIQVFQAAKRIASPRRFKILQRPMTVLAGTTLGTLVTLTSIGAGALGAVLLRTLYPLRMQPGPLIATDTIHVIPVSLIGGLSFLLLGYTDLNILGLLLMGSVPMAIVGSSLIKQMPIRVIKLLLASVLVIAGIKLLLT